MPRLALLWLVVGATVFAVWLPSLGARMVAGLGATWAALSRAVGDTPEQRIQRASGISPALVAAIRAALPADGRLVVYSPYGGAEFELDGADPRGEPARQVRVLFERAKNLLYPFPRDVAFARDADELRGKIEPGCEGRLLVIDGTQEPVELTIGGRYDFVHEEPIGTAKLRLWRLRERR